MNLQAVVLAAGRGRRLGRLTRERSKAMLPVAGKPMVARVCDQLVAAGAEVLILVVQPGDREIQGYFETHPPQVPVKWVYQAESLGTAHALLAAVPHIQGDFLLSACDSLVGSDEITGMIDRWRETKAASLALMRVSPEEISRKSAVQLEGPRVVAICEKPEPGQAMGNIASLPLYLLPARLLRLLKEVPLSQRGEYELQDALQMWINQGEPVEGVFLGRRLELTTEADLLALNLHFLRQVEAQAAEFPPDIGGGVRFQLPVRVDHGVRIEAGARIGPLVYLEAGCRVGASASLEEAVVLRSARVPPGARISGQVLSG